MNKEFLEDYAANEYKAYEKYSRDFLSGATDVIYPESRFSNLQDPIVYSDPSCYAESKTKIWNQMPLAGTLIVSLRNSSEENCIYSHGFEPSDIPKLIDIAKETGRVGFGLSTNPKGFEGLDYLQPIFNELKPPLLRGKPPDHFITKEDSNKNWEEFMTLGNIRYLDHVENQLNMSGNSQMIKNVIDKRYGAFERLKILKMDKELEDLSNQMVDDPKKADSLFHYYITVLEPIFDALTPNQNLSLKRFNQLDMKISSKPNFQIPEIGDYLMKKTLLNPSSYYGCIDAINQYKQNDLGKVMNSLTTAVKEHQTEEVIESTKELDIILDNVWNDASKLGKKKEYIRDGISVVLGLVGSMITPAMGGMGLLAGLGFNVLDRRLEMKNFSASDKIIKAINPDYLVNIYDFQQKQK